MSTERGEECIDRETEFAELERLFDAEGPGLILLYGRRRVGKTFLLSCVSEGRRSFYFLAGDTTPDRNRQDLLRELSLWLGEELPGEDYPSWRTVFRLFARLSEKEPLVVVLDEFQFLMGSEEGIASQLNAIWDREVGRRKLKVVLCGSEVGIMAGLEAADSPLYGRLGWAHQLRPFDYFDTSRMVPGRSHRETACVYGIFGGMPQYLGAVRPDESLAETVVRALLSPRGEVGLQLENLIEQEHGIRETGTYRAILTAVAEGNTGTNEVAQEAGVEDPQVVRRVLETLESLGLVRRERNFRAARRTPWRNRVAEHAVRFWYRYVYPNRSRLATGDPKTVWEARIEPNLDTYMGKVFEEICQEAFLRHHARWRLPGPVVWARWEGSDRGRRSIEIDVAAELDGGRLLTGEVKWSSSPVDYDLHLIHVRNLEDLGESGHAWAREALDPGSSHGHIYFSAAGFTELFRRKAEENDRLRLIDLPELYAGR